MHEMVKFPSGPNLTGPDPVPYNKFGYARHLLTPQAHFVSPNNDSMYMFAICDVRSGPLVLHVPDTHDRYYVLQFVDAWTNNFAYVGRRATGTAAGVSPFESITHEGREVVFNDRRMGELAVYLLKTLTSIQSGTVADRHGWMVAV